MHLMQKCICKHFVNKMFSVHFASKMFSIKNTKNTTMLAKRKTSKKKQVKTLHHKEAWR